MSHLRNIFIAYWLRSYARRYLEEKKRSAMASPLKERKTKSDLKTREKRPVFYTCLHNKRFLSIMRIFWYCLCSFILTYLILVVIIFHLKLRVMWAVIVCSFLGVLLGLAMHNNENVRCYVFLALPQVTSKYGRKALIAYCYVLLLIGPTKNILINIGHVADTITCAQSHVKEEFRKLEKALKEPLLEAKHAIEKIINAIEQSVKSAVEEVRKVEAIAQSILHAFEKAGKWLASNLNVCKKTLGTPFERCKFSYEHGIAACKEKLGVILGISCNFDYILEGTCYIFKPLDYFCEFVHYIEDTVLADIKQKVKMTIDQIEEFFYVKIHFKDDIKISWNTSVKPSEVVEDVLWGLKANLKASVVFISWLGSVTMFILIIVFLRVLWYHKKFLTKDRFDNIYITDDFILIDMENAKRFDRTVLPLKSYEKHKYIRYSCCWLNGSERFRFVKSSTVLLFTCIKICLFLLVDYFMYWLLNAIYLADIYNEDTSALHYGGLEVNIEGKGYQADVYRTISEEVLKFKHVLGSFEFKSCLIRPSEPDFELYLHIGVMLSFCWIAIIAEPYILRLRNSLMCKMYPRRSKERALWLFHKILRERDMLYNLAHKQLRHVFSGKENPKGVVNVSFVEYIARKLLPHCIYKLWLSLDTTDKCMQCGSINGLKFCSTYKCKGVFCNDCWNHFTMKCPLCGVVESDFSEEIDSEDEVAVNAKIEKYKMKKLKESEGYHKIMKQGGGQITSNEESHKEDRANKDDE